MDTADLTNVFTAIYMFAHGDNGEFAWLYRAETSSETTTGYHLNYTNGGNTNISVQKGTIPNGTFETMSLNIGADGSISAITPAGELNLAPTFTSDTVVDIYAQSAFQTADWSVDNITVTTTTAGTPSTYVSSFTTQKDFNDLGYTFDNTTAFELLDKNNQSSGMISLGEQAGASTLNNVTYSQASISEAIRASDISGTDVDFGFDEGGRLQFFTKSKGSDSAITINTLTTNDGTIDKASSKTSLDSTFGFDSYSERGWGDQEFQIHVADTRLGFQTGANQSQKLTFGVGNFGTEGLGINGLDMTNYNKSTEALGLLDEAINTVSSARSQLGSLQNRLTSTINNLQVIPIFLLLNQKSEM